MARQSLQSAAIKPNPAQFSAGAAMSESQPTSGLEYSGIVKSGPYKGQSFGWIVYDGSTERHTFPGWVFVELHDESGVAVREVRERDLLWREV